MGGYGETGKSRDVGSHDWIYLPQTSQPKAALFEVNTLMPFLLSRVSALSKMASIFFFTSSIMRFRFCSCSE